MGVAAREDAPERDHNRWELLRRHRSVIAVTAFTLVTLLLSVCLALPLLAIIRLRHYVLDPNALRSTHKVCHSFTVSDTRTQCAARDMHVLYYSPAPAVWSYTFWLELSCD